MAMTLAERLARVEERLHNLEVEVKELVGELRNERHRMEQRLRSLEERFARYNAIHNWEQKDVKLRTVVVSAVIAALSTGFAIGSGLVALLR